MSDNVYDPKVNYAEKVRELGITASHNKTAEVSPDAQGRVEFRKVGKHFLGYRETYLFVREYATHAETWWVVQTDHPSDAGHAYLRNSGFKDREGHWWLCWHSFYDTNERAHEAVARDAQERTTEYHWNDENVFIGVL
jgi:hypothetical protein